MSSESRLTFGTRRLATNHTKAAELLRWMSDKPEIVAILHDLKNNGPVYQRLNLGPHRQARAEVARTVGAEKILRQSV
jgi:hypothetical protein